MLPDDLSPLLSLPTPHLREQLERNRQALADFLKWRYIPDSDMPQEYINDTRRLIHAIEEELARREGSSLP